jgi:NTP pyrophosphatase (non-canonical NTP hydrolase)
MIGNELGDVLWYLSVLASKVGLTLEDVANLNMEKRQTRKENGTERGCGDKR